MPFCRLSIDAGFVNLNIYEYEIIDEIVYCFRQEKPQWDRTESLSASQNTLPALKMVLILGHDDSEVHLRGTQHR